jgi:hypothetical protein
MSHYYFVGTVLPTLSFDYPPEITFEKFLILLKDNLSERDYEKTRIIRRFYDIMNLRSLWLEEKLDPIGELDEKELDETLASREGLPNYVYAYLDVYEKIEERIKHFPQLLAKVFQSYQSVNDPLLEDYLNFERELRLVLVAFRAKKLDWDLSSELQYEDPEEELIAQMLAQKDAKDYEPPEKYQDLKVLLENLGDDPLALQKALDQYRFDYLESKIDMADQSSIERILVYMIQLILIEKWTKMDKVKGNEIVDIIVKEA